MKTNDYNQWVCFYELDYLFMRVWKQPRRYIEKLKKFSLIGKDDFWEQWLEFDLQEKKELGIVYKDVQEEEKAICELLFDMTSKQMKLKRTKDNIFTSINSIAMNRIKTDKTYDAFKKKLVKMIK